MQDLGGIVVILGAIGLAWYGILTGNLVISIAVLLSGLALVFTGPTGS